MTVATQEPSTQLDGQVFVERFGSSGPPMVLLHGLGSSHAHWRAVAPRLGRNWSVYVPDLPGFGRTPLAGRSTDVAGYRAFTSHFLEQLPGPAVLVGNSMGALLAILAAADHPDRVRSLVLVATPAPRPVLTPLPPRLAVLFSAYAWPVLGEVTRGAWVRLHGPDGMVRTTFEACCARPDRVPASVRAAALAMARERHSHEDEVHVFLAAYRSMLRYLLNGPRFDRIVRRIGAHALVIHGAEDRLIPLSVARRIQRLRPDWRFEVLLGVGHMPQVEASAAFVRLVADEAR